MSRGSSFGVLRGVRVIDLTRALSGPFCTMILADHGADVIKVEEPGGDTTRQAGPFIDGNRAAGLGGFFQSANRNKRSIVIDLKKDDGKNVLRRLIANADILAENFRSGVMERLGFSFDDIKSINPRIVVASISGFGDPRNGESPYIKWPALDVVAQAMGGLIGTTGPDAGTPVRAGPALGDIIPGIYAAFGIVAALRYAERTGEAQHVDVAMLDSVLAVCEAAAYRYSFSGIVPAPTGNDHTLAAPIGVFAARDGWIAIAAPQENQWTTLCRMLGLETLLDDDRFSHYTKRRENLATLKPLLSEKTALYTKSQLVDLLGGEIPIGPILGMDEIFADPHFRTRKMLVEVEEPGTGQSRSIVGSPVKFTETPGRIDQRAPLLGEHSKAILADTGFDADEIDKLFDADIVA